MFENRKKVKASKLLSILLFSCLTATLVYAYRDYHDYPSDTLTAYDYWDKDYGCEFLDFNVTMDDITTNRRLFVEIHEHYWQNDTFYDELFYGYLEDGEKTPVVQPEDSENLIHVYVTETDGYQTYFQLHVYGKQFNK